VIFSAPSPAFALTTRVSGAYRSTVTLTLNTAGADTVAFDAAATALSVLFSSYEYDATKSGATVTVLEPTALAVTLDAPRRVVSATFGRGTTAEFVRLDLRALAERPTATAVKDAALVDDFTDARFAVRLRDAAGLVGNLATTDLSALKVCSYPTGPRLAIGGDVFWQAPGRLDGVTAADGTALAQALQRFVDGLPRPLPASLQVPLAIESDAPCMVALSALSIAYAPVVEGERHEMRLSGPGDVGTVLVHLPSGAQPRAASVRTVETFVGAPPEPAAASLPQRHGVAVSAGVWTAGRVVTDAPRALGEIAVGLLAVDAPAELVFELREDRGGEPAGPAIASGTFVLEEPGTRAWGRLALDGVALVPSVPLWVLVTAARGRAVWLGAPGTPATAVRRLPGEPAEGLILALAVRDAGPVAVAPPALALAVGGTAVPLGVAVNRERETDFLAQIAGTEVALEFSATAPVALIVDGVRVEYDLV
jgi:hypothetical protein